MGTNLKRLAKKVFLTALTLYSGISLAAEFRPVSAKPHCDGLPANFAPFLVPKQLWNWELVEALDEAPSVWVQRTEGKLRIGLHTAAHITYWTCPPDGDSQEATIHKTFIAIYENLPSTGISQTEQSLIGYTPIDLYRPQPISLSPSVDVIDDMNDYYDEIDGSGASLEYRGPADTVDIGISADFDPVSNETLQVIFPNACGTGRPLAVTYRKINP